MEQLSGVMIPAVAGVVALLGVVWAQSRPSRRVRRAMERAEARARSVRRH